MTHSNRHNKKYIIPLGIFIVLIILVSVFRVQSFALVSSFARPILNVVHFESLSQKAGYFESKQSLLEKNRALESEVARLHVFMLDRKQLRSENKELRAVLHRKDEEGLILANILSKPPVSAYDTFIIDIGSKAGIRLGDQVFMYGNVRIGKIVSTSGMTAKVALYSSPGNTSDAFLGEENIPIEVTGAGAGNFTTTVPQGVSVPIGALVTLPGGMNGILGSVEYVKQKGNDTFQEVFIKSPVQVWSLRFVQVARANSPEAS